jgi:hypothetical protein
MGIVFAGVHESSRFRIAFGSIAARRDKCESDYMINLLEKRHERYGRGWRA